MRSCSLKGTLLQDRKKALSRFLPAGKSDRILDPLLNLFFPESCFICATPVAKRRYRGVCPNCLGKALALKIRQPFCPSCGLPLQYLESGSGALCVECILSPPPYAGARSFGFYSGEIASLVHGLKFLGKRNLAGLMTFFLAEAFYENWDSTSFDLVIPVPLHKRRRRERGYNQSDLVAREMARRIRIPHNNRLLIRTRDSVSQVGLSDRQRRKNVRNAFSCTDSGRISGRRILLIDDVMTTGATVRSASKTLVEAGALRVSVLVLARTEL